MAAPLAPLVPLAVIGGKVASKVARKAWSKAKKIDKKVRDRTQIDDQKPDIHHMIVGGLGAAAAGAATSPKKPNKNASLTAGLPKSKNKKPKRNASLTAGLPKSKNKKAKPPGLIKNRKASSIVRRKK
jgi:hypothetical protein